MLDPRFANAGAAPFVAGFGAQQVPMSYHHHRHHKHRSRRDQSPPSRDESIHKVDHGQTHVFQQTDGAPFTGGYSAPFNVGMFAQQATPYYAANMRPFPTQYPNFQFGFGANQAMIPPVAAPASNIVPPTMRHHHHHRRHHRHHRNQLSETGNPPTEIVDQVQAVPEPLIGQRSSSVVGDDATGPTRSPAPGDDEEAHGEHPTTHHYRHRHHGGERVDGVHRKKHDQNQQSSGDGYGHINNDLIFIERGDHSPHRQDPPPGYEYKGKIEVQGATRENRSQSRGRETYTTGAPTTIPAPIPAPPIVPNPVLNICPPGWHPVVISTQQGGGIQQNMPIFPGQLNANNAAFQGAGFPQPTAATPGVNGLANLAATLPIPPQGQIVADYIVEAGETHGTSNSTAEGGFSRQDRHGSSGRSPSTTFRERYEESHEVSTTRPTIIEVWQKRPKSAQGQKFSPQESSDHDRSQSRDQSQSQSRSQPRSRSRHRSRSRSPRPSQSIDFDRFRNEILNAIERIAKRGGSGAHDGGTQTQIHQTTGGGDARRDQERRTDSSGEVRVIVQPIQPVFYMPRQGATTPQQGGPAIGFPSQQSSGGSGGAPNVVYVPRNVYVPVIKPVFVPRERVIVRPQVIHVARPVLVDRPVPVTQRPIIIDRERPVPVPIRSGSQSNAQASGSNVVREEYVYRDNLPVAYGGRCAEFTGGVNYGYVPAQQDAQYAASSTQEVTSNYQAQAPVLNINVADQFNASQSNSHIEVQQDVASFHGSFSNLAQTSGVASAGASVNVDDLNQSSIQQTIDQAAQAAGLPPCGSAQIEILDTTVNPYWQKTDQSGLVRRYGRPAYEIVNKTDQVEQQMYTELRRQSGNVEIQRTMSSASYGSGAGIDCVSGIPQY